MMNTCELCIAIDGPASCGKGTVGFLLAEYFSYRFLDTGAMYRAVAVMALKERLRLDDDFAVGNIAKNTLIDFTKYVDAEKISYKTFANGVDISDDIRSPEADVASSKVAVLPAVRKILVSRQKEIASTKRVVMEGRDIATVVIPDAEVKIFLTASVEERARRRYTQRIKRGLAANLDELINELTERDQRDKKREVGALKVADDAFTIDSTDLTAEETVKRLVDMILNQFPCAI